MPSKKSYQDSVPSRRNKASRAKAPKPLLTGPEPGGIASNDKFAQQIIFNDLNLPSIIINSQTAVITTY